MEQYTCEECGGSFGEEDLDQEALSLEIIIAFNVLNNYQKMVGML